MKDKQERLKKLAPIYEGALNILNYSSQTEQMLKNKLLKKGYVESDILEVIDILKEDRLIDDRSYGQLYASELAHNKRYGPKRIVCKLMERGIDQSEAQQFAIEAMNELGGEQLQLLRYLSKESNKIIKLYEAENFNKIMAKIHQRGFQGISFYQLKEILNDLFHSPDKY